jgi:aromatic-amino-acid transaminase
MCFYISSSSAAMNASLSSSFLSHVELAPADPIIGVTDAFRNDPNPNKVNLGTGVYCDDAGKVPLLECVRRAESRLVDAAAPRVYLPIDGLPAYNKAARELLFCPDSSVVAEGRVVTIQALGGTGGLKLGADFLHRFAPRAHVWVSDPSWENHRALFQSAGFPVHSYAYYDAANHRLDFAAMIESLARIPGGDIVVLHACCHNPTGVDLTSDQWTTVIQLIAQRGLIPFLDVAYQGFGDGIEADGAVVRRFAETVTPLFVANSFSKSFSLYGERIGALSVVAAHAQEAARCWSQLKRVVRTNYSNPPTTGGQIVATVLATPELRGIWERELNSMRDRIRLVRAQFVEQLKQKAPSTDFSFVMRQRGMFSYSGLSKQIVGRLRDTFSIYALDSGRICVAALNSRNIDYVTDAIACVISSSSAVRRAHASRTVAMPDRTVSAARLTS